MMKTRCAVLAASAVLLSQTACYTTKIVTNRQASGPAYTDRQWFALGGLANVSSPAGRECQNGVAWAESKMGFVDFLINVGLSAAGGVAGSLMCQGDQVASAYCGATGAGLLPFLLSTRTVEYACAAGPTASTVPAWMPENARGAKVSEVESAPTQAPAAQPAPAATTAN